MEFHEILANLIILTLPFLKLLFIHLTEFTLYS